MGSFSIPGLDAAEMGNLISVLLYYGLFYAVYGFIANPFYGLWSKFKSTKHKTWGWHKLKSIKVITQVTSAWTAFGILFIDKNIPIELAKIGLYGIYVLIIMCMLGRTFEKISFTKGDLQIKADVLTHSEERRINKVEPPVVKQALADMKSAYNSKKAK
jgi:hypothetical protein